MQILELKFCIESTWLMQSRIFSPSFFSSGNCKIRVFYIIGILSVMDTKYEIGVQSGVFCCYLGNLLKVLIRRKNTRPRRQILDSEIRSYFLFQINFPYQLPGKRLPLFLFNFWYLDIWISIEVKRNELHIESIPCI